MRTFVALICLAFLVACGGSDPAPQTKVLPDPVVKPAELDGWILVDGFVDGEITGFVDLLRADYRGDATDYDLIVVEDDRTMMVRLEFRAASILDAERVGAMYCSGPEVDSWTVDSYHSDVSTRVSTEGPGAYRVHFEEVGFSGWLDLDHR